MSPVLILVILVAMLLAMLPVWRLRVAGWRPAVLFWTWLVYTVALLVVLRLPGAGRSPTPVPGLPEPPEDAATDDDRDGGAR